MTTVALPRRVSPFTTAIVNEQVERAAEYPLDETNPHLDPAVRAIATALQAEAGHTLLDRDGLLDCVVALVDTDQQLKDLDDNPDEYLNSIHLPRTTEQRLITEADLRSQRAMWMDRLCEMAR